MDEIKPITLPEQFQYIQAIHRIHTSCTDTNGSQHLLPLTIAQVYCLLPENNNHIVRVHRSWIINKDYVASVMPGNAFHMALLRMKDGTVVPVQKSSIRHIMDLVH